MRYIVRRIIRIWMPLAAGLIFLATGTQVFAGRQDSQEPSDLFDLSIEELMEIPIVVSSSRQGQKLNESSVPISIVTSADIHYSGLTNIPEILQFVPGVDVVKFNRLLFGVGVHGMHETISNHLLSLVDGRFANNPVFGGPEFHRLPIFLEDIERIEVVRGPGGAAWGANAFTGTVNIITKDPEDTLGYFGSTTISEFGDTFTHLRWGAKKEDWSWRLSVGYEGIKDSDRTGAGDYMTTSPWIIGPPDPVGYSTYRVHDFSRTWRFDSKAVYRVSQATKITLGAGYSHVLSGDFEMIGWYPRKNNRAELLRTFAKVDHEFDDGSSGYIQLVGNFSNMNWVNAAIYDVKEYDIEAQYNFADTGNHKITVGGNFRWDRIDIEGQSHSRREKYYGVERDMKNAYYWFGQPYDELWSGLFAMDRWTVTDRFTLEAQMRLDWYSETQTDWSNRFSVLYDLNGEKKHVVRLSVARAFRSPLVSLRKATAETVPFPWMPGVFYHVINLADNEDLKNEQTWSFEAGYTGRLTNKFTLTLNTFYQRLSNLIGYRRSPGPIMPALSTTFTPENIDGASMFGGEMELAYEDTNKKLSVWYAYDNFELDQSNQPIRAYRPVKHKCGLTGRLFLDGGWTMNANLKISGTTPKNPHFESNEANLGSFNRLDLTLAKQFADGRGELMFGVSDLLNKTREATVETITMTGHETPGRMFFTRLQYQF